MGKFTRGQKFVAAGTTGFDGLSAGRSGSLLGSLVARVAPIPQSSLKAAPKRVQEAVKVVEDYVESLDVVKGGKGVKPAQ